MASNCAGTTSFTASSQFSFQPTIVSSVPRNDTYLMPSGENTVSAENCSVFSTTILFIKPESFMSLNRSDSAILRSMGSVLVEAMSPNLSPASSWVAK